MDKEKLAEILQDRSKQIELSRRQFRHKRKYAEYYEFHGEPTFAYVVGGIACVLGIVAAFLDGLIFYISLSVLILLIVLVIRLMARYDKRKKELETKGFESPTEEELLAYQEAVDFFAYQQSRIPSGGGI